MAQNSNYIIRRNLDYSKTVPNSLELDRTHQVYPSTSNGSYTLDLYLPLVAGAGENREVPVVVFVHGGGWRRGNKTAWMYYLSKQDTNLLVAFVTWWFGLYGNVGETFAHDGIACAVVNYPLCYMGFPWNIFDLIASYSLSVLLLTPLVVIIMMIIAISDSWLYDTAALRQFDSVFWTCMAAVATVANLLISVLMCAFHKNYNLSPNTAFFICFIRVVYLFVTPYVFHMSLESWIYFCGTSTTFVQISLQYFYMVNAGYQPINYSDQLGAISKAICWVQNLGQHTNCFNPHLTFLMGHSAGAHLVSMVTMQPFKLKRCQLIPIKGVIAVSGIFDLNTLNNFLGRTLYLRPIVSTTQKQLKDASPLYCLDNMNIEDIPKFLVVNSKNDLFLLADATAMCQKLHSVGVKCCHCVIDGSSHFTIMNLFQKVRSTPKDNKPSLPDVCIKFMTS